MSVAAELERPEAAISSVTLVLGSDEVYKSIKSFVGEERERDCNLSLKGRLSIFYRSKKSVLRRREGNRLNLSRRLRLRLWLLLL